MRVGELIPITKMTQQGSVPAGKAATAEFGVIGLSMKVSQPKGDTSKSAYPMPKYKTLPKQTQGTSIKEDVERIAKGGATAKYWSGLFSTQNPNRSSWSAKQQELEAALLDGSPEKFIIRDGDRIVGAVAFFADTEAVHIEHLGSISAGAGTTLMKRVQQFASRKKLPITLVPSTEAMGFYKKLGFTPTGRGNLWSK